MASARPSACFEHADTVAHLKEGTVLQMRHEIGVLKHREPVALAIAVLSESSVPAQRQPAAERALGLAAKLLHDRVRSAPA